jgi:hypothetical protein
MDSKRWPSEIEVEGHRVWRVGLCLRVRGQITCLVGELWYGWRWCVAASLTRTYRPVQCVCRPRTAETCARSSESVPLPPQEVCARWLGVFVRWTVWKSLVFRLKNINSVWFLGYRYGRKHQIQLCMQNDWLIDWLINLWSQDDIGILLVSLIYLCFTCL